MHGPGTSTRHVVSFVWCFFTCAFVNRLTFVYALRHFCSAMLLLVRRQFHVAKTQMTLRVLRLIQLLGLHFCFHLISCSDKQESELCSTGIRCLFIFYRDARDRCFSSQELVLTCLQHCQRVVMLHVVCFHLLTFTFKVRFNVLLCSLTCDLAHSLWCIHDAD